IYPDSPMMAGESSNMCSTNSSASCSLASEAATLRAFSDCPEKSMGTIMLFILLFFRLNGHGKYTGIRFFSMELQVESHADVPNERFSFFGHFDLVWPNFDQTIGFQFR